MARQNECSSIRISYRKNYITHIFQEGGGGVSKMSSSFLREATRLKRGNFCIRNENFNTVPLTNF